MSRLMSTLRIVLGLSLLILFGYLMVACSGHTAYPPALPGKGTGSVPWGNETPFVPTTPPPPELTYQDPPPRRNLGPSEAEQHELRAYVPPKQVCTGRGKQRVCKAVPASDLTAVDQANVTALVKPSVVHTRDGQSVLVRYPIDPQGFKVYQIITSHTECTNLLLPGGERPVAELTLSAEDWHVQYTKPGSETAMQLIKVCPRVAGLKGRDMLLTRSGYPLYLEFVSTERPGMLSVTWDPPVIGKVPPPPPLDQRPPKFSNGAAYTGYTMQLIGNQKLTPPWMPHTVVDDGKNTVIGFNGSLDGQRLPMVVGLDQQGKAVIVASRLYVHQDPTQASSYWMFVQRLHPALELKDASGITVRIVREVPKEEARHAVR